MSLGTPEYSAIQKLSIIIIILEIQTKRGITGLFIAQCRSFKTPRPTPVFFKRIGMSELLNLVKSINSKQTKMKINHSEITN